MDRTLNLSDARTLQIGIANPWRFNIYRAILERAFAALEDRCASDEMRSLIRSPGLWEGLARQLDEALMHFIAGDAQEKRCRNLSRYYSQNAALLSAQDHFIYGKLAQLAEDFTLATSTVLNRITNDKVNLVRVFSPVGGGPEGYRFTNVSVLDSDMHRPGCHVLKISLQRSDDPAINIIYKPTSVTNAMVAFGNVALLKERLPDLELRCECSFAEWVNHRMADTMHCYLVYPFDHPEHVEESYGYMACIGSSPRMKEVTGMSQEEIFSELLFQVERGVLREDRLSFMFEKLRSQQLEKYYQHMSKNPDRYDHVMCSPRELIGYSCRAGVLAGVLSLIHLSDQHQDNILVVKLMLAALGEAGGGVYPVSIDPETMGEAKDFELSSTLASAGLLAVRIGRTRRYLRSKFTPETGPMGQFDYTDRRSVLMLGEAGELREARPLKGPFCEGFSSVFFLVKNDYVDFRDVWLNAEAVRTMSSRRVPLATVELESTLRLVASATSDESRIHVVEKFRRVRCEEILKNILEISPVAFGPDRLALHHALISHDMTRRFLHYCIPTTTIPSAERGDVVEFGAGSPLIRDDLAVCEFLRSQGVIESISSLDISVEGDGGKKDEQRQLALSREFSDAYHCERRPKVWLARRVVLLAESQRARWLQQLERNVCHRGKCVALVVEALKHREVEELSDEPPSARCLVYPLSPLPVRRGGLGWLASVRSRRLGGAPRRRGGDAAVAEGGLALDAPAVNPEYKKALQEHWERRLILRFGDSDDMRSAIHSLLEKPHFFRYLSNYEPIIMALFDAEVTPDMCSRVLDSDFFDTILARAGEVLERLETEEDPGRFMRTVMVGGDPESMLALLFDPDHETCLGTGDSWTSKF